MTALNLKAHGRRFVWPYAGVACAAVVLFSYPRADIRPRMAPAAPELAVSRSKPFAPASALPFRAGEIIDYLTGALALHPKQVGNSTVFESPANESAANSFSIAVTEESRGLAVLFTGKGDYAMSIAREFFEVPFFTREESLRFYALLSEERRDQTVNLSRFTLRFQLLEHKDDFHLTMRFSSAKP
jgi:hypothetical protein